MGGILAVVLSGVQNPGAKMALIPVEILMSTIPFVGLMLSFCKLLWRAIMYTEKGKTSDLDPYGFEGCLPEIIGMSCSILIFPILTLFVFKCCKSG